MKKEENAKIPISLKLIAILFIISVIMSFEGVLETLMFSGSWLLSSLIVFTGIFQIIVGVGLWRMWKWARITAIIIIISWLISNLWFFVILISVNLPLLVSEWIFNQNQIAFVVGWISMFNLFWILVQSLILASIMENITHSLYSSLEHILSIVLRITILAINIIILIYLLLNKKVKELFHSRY